MLTIDNLLFAIRNTTEVSDDELETLIDEAEDPTPREQNLLFTCMELYRPELHFDILNRRELAAFRRDEEAQGFDDEFYTALI